jgi:serine/threonine protein kinase
MLAMPANDYEGVGLLERPIGTVIAGYRVEEVVGRGGMGVVYRAMDVLLERPVALKLIAPESPKSPASVLASRES